METTSQEIWTYVDLEATKADILFTCAVNINSAPQRTLTIIIIIIVFISVKTNRSTNIQ